MLPFKPIFLGKLPKEAPPTAASQRCVRINDVENLFVLPDDRLWISVYDDDDETYAIWHDDMWNRARGLVKMTASGATGACGPYSEIYYDFHPERGNSGCWDHGDDARFIEFYNLIFMQYNKRDDGSLEPLKPKNIDTGLGLECMAQILQQG
ncbi:hypothetical protein OROMI_031463 [Orobanche minor]